MKKDGQVLRASVISKMVNSMRMLNASKRRGKNPLDDDIKRAATELENIRRFFDVADDPELIEYAIFTEKAAVTRLSYLIKKAKVKEELLNSSNN